MISDKRLFYICMFILILFNTSFRWPVENGKITSTYGESRWDHYHDGVDMVSPDDKIYPVADGRLVYFWDKSIFPVDNYPGGGNYKIIDHGKGLYSLYMHLADGLRIKDKYNRDELLGMIGNTGHSMGKHLHFSFLKRYERSSVNPFSWLPDFKDLMEPVVSDIYIRIKDRYFLINDRSNIRLTQHYPFLVQMQDSISGKNRLGIYRFAVHFNNKKVLDIDFSKIDFSKNGLTIHGFQFLDLYDEKGFYKVKGISYLEGENRIKVTAYDFSGNMSEREVSFNVKLDIRDRM